MLITFSEILLFLFLCFQIFQLIAIRWLYFDYVNIVDWFTYISVILVVADFTNCGAREVGTLTFLKRGP